MQNIAILLTLEFVDGTLHENHKNWYPMKIKPSTECLQFMQDIPNLISCSVHVFIFCLHFQFMQDRVNAMKDYQDAIKMDPSYSLAYFNAANVYFHTRHFRQVGHNWLFKSSLWTVNLGEFNDLTIFVNIQYI